MRKNKDAENGSAAAFNSHLKVQLQSTGTIILVFLLVITITTSIASLMKPWDVKYPFSNEIAAGILVGVFTLTTTLSFLCLNYPKNLENASKIQQMGVRFFYATLLYVLFFILAALVKFVGQGDILRVIFSMILVIPAEFALVVMSFYIMTSLAELLYDFNTIYFVIPVNKFFKKK